MSIWTDPTANPLNDNGGTGKGNGHDTSRDPNAIGATRDTAVWQGRAYVREVDGCWRDEFGRTLGRDETGWHITEPSPLWRPQPLSRWLKKTIPPREWFIEDWLPLGQCTGSTASPACARACGCCKR